MGTRNTFSRRLTVIMLVLMMPVWVSAETLTIPFGTVVYCELAQEVTSRRKHFSEGDLVRAHIWKDVVVKGSVVIEKGTPVFARISKLKTAKVAGIKGFVGIDALNVQGIDSTDIPLDGGYDRSGRSNMALSITLAVVIFAPLIFIKGKHAKLVPGTVFDAVVRQATDVKFDGPRKVEPDLGTDPLTIEILYDDIQFTKKNKVEYLPMLITRCDGPIHDAAITAVNGTGIPAIPLSIIGRDVGETDDGCNLARVNADFREFGKQLRPGLNRFTVRTGEQSKEVLLEIEF